jgi:hypothetical protein
MKVTREFVYADTATEKYKDKMQSGWLIKDKPNFDPIPTHRLRSHVLVHDIVEHHPEDDESVEFEMMAAGATFFIRELGKWNRYDYHTPQWIMNSDFRYFLRLCKYEVKDTDGEIHPDLMNNYHYVMENINGMFDPLEDKRHLVDIGFKWITKGYIRAMERWKGHTSADVCRMCERMEKELDHVIENDEDDYRKNGCGMKITFDIATLEYSIEYNRDEPIEKEKVKPENTPDYNSGTMALMNRFQVLDTSGSTNDLIKKKKLIPLTIIDIDINNVFKNYQSMRAKEMEEMYSTMKENLKKLNIKFKTNTEYGRIMNMTAI